MCHHLYPPYVTTCIHTTPPPVPTLYHHMYQPYGATPSPYLYPPYANNCTREWRSRTKIRRNFRFCPVSPGFGFVRPFFFARFGPVLARFCPVPPRMPLDRFVRFRPNSPELIHFHSSCACAVRHSLNCTHPMPIIVPSLCHPLFPAYATTYTHPIPLSLTPCHPLHTPYATTRSGGD